MLKIQEFISCFGSIEEANTCLEKELSLDITRHNLYNYEKNSKIYIYNKGRYSDIDNPLVREANGLMLDEDHVLVSKSHDHHYKVKTIKDLPKDFKLYRSNIEEMTIGMMVTIFNYKGVWTIANKNSINDVDYTIDVKRAIGKGLDQWWTSIFDENKNYIYVFDFISRKYESIWPCPTFQLYLLTIIDTDKCKDLDINVIDDMAKRLGFSRPRHKNIIGRRSLNSFMSAARIPSRGVIISNNGVRVKLPNSLYYSVKSANDAEDRVKPIHVAKIFLACKNEMELMVISQSFPKYDDFLKLFDRTMKETLQNLLAIWGSIQEFINDSETFAKAVPSYPLNHLLFMYKKKKIKTLEEGVAKTSPHVLINITAEKYEKEFESYSNDLKIEYDC